MSLVSRHLYRRGRRETLKFVVPCKLVLGRLACFASRFLLGKTLHLDKSDRGSISVDVRLVNSRA
jgi:hypothetical protein